MAKRKKRQVSENTTIKFVELQCAVLSHCQALKAVTSLLIEGRIEAAVARLDGAVAAMQAVVRGQCAGESMKCPDCGSEQDVVAWVDDKKCNVCGADLQMPEVGG